MRCSVKRVFIKTSLVVLGFICFSCSEDDTNPMETIEESSNEWEAEVAELTTAMQKYKDFDLAVSEGYNNDLSGYVPQMGHHYVKGSLVDGIFDLLNPEILLFVPSGDSMELVGVEYMVPFTDPDNPQPAPSGFKGSADTWERNERMNTWTLHVWIIKENPSGIFAPLNPSLP